MLHALTLPIPSFFSRLPACHSLKCYGNNNNNNNNPSFSPRSLNSGLHFLWRCLRCHQPWSSFHDTNHSPFGIGPSRANPFLRHDGSLADYAVLFSRFQMTPEREAVEILVHINAPSRVSDDVFYRELAQAYLDFEPACITALPAPAEDQQRHEGPRSKEKAAEAQSRPARHPENASSSQEYATPAPMPPLLDSQDLSFQSALDNRESPRLGDAVAGTSLGGSKSSQDMGDAVESQKSWLAPPSEVGDSYPMPDPSLLRVSPSKVLERYLRSSAARQDKHTPSPARSSSFLDTSQAGNRIEVPSSPPRGWVEVPSSEPEPAALPTIPSSPPLPGMGLSVVPLSSDSDKEGTVQLISGPDELLDATQPFSNQPEEEHGILCSQKGASQPASDEIVEITYSTDSLIEDGPQEPRLKGDAAATVRPGRPQDSLEVTHITSSPLAADLPAALHSQKHLQPAVAEDHLDVTHISMSSAGDSPGAAPSQKGELLPRADETLDVTHVSGTSFEITSAMSQHSPDSSPLAKRRRRSADASPSPVTDAGVATDAYAADATPGSMTIEPAESSSLEIIPPPPPAGLHTIHPDDLIPQQLSKLCADLSSRYRPSTPARTLAPLERGHWLLDCDSWPAKARDSTWAFLRQYARSGLAGWGLWCRREEKPHRFIKVYCWGHLVKHAYLLLYLASERRLKGTRAVWVDAGGEVVIEVAPHVK